MLAAKERMHVLQLLTSWDADTPGGEEAPEGLAHLPEGHGEGAGLAGARLLGGAMFQDDAIALQDHQWLPVQGRGARLGPLRHREAQLSSIGGHLGYRVDGCSAEVPVGGPCHCPHLFHVLSKGTRTLLFPNLCLCHALSLPTPRLPCPLGSVKGGSRSRLQAEGCGRRRRPVPRAWARRCPGWWCGCLRRWSG